MLERLVDEIRAGGALETKALALRLGTSPQLVEAMLEHLGRSGYIQAYMNCGDACGGCSLQEACSKSRLDAPRLWQSNTED